MFKICMLNTNSNHFFQFFELFNDPMDLKFLTQNKTISNIEIRMLHILFPSAILMSTLFTNYRKVFSVRICIWTVRVWMMTPDTRQNKFTWQNTVLLSAINNYYTCYWEVWYTFIMQKLTLGEVTYEINISSLNLDGS